MKATADHGRWWRTLPAQGSDRGFGALHLEIDPAMRSRRVVVLDELGEHALEMTLVSDEQPVEAFCARGANEPLCERVGTRRAERCLDHPSANRGDHLIEGPDELRVAVADQELDYSAFVLERHCKIASLLGDPAADRVLGDTGQEDLAALEIDKEQHIEPTERDHVDVEKVTRQRAGRLGAKQLREGRS